MPRSLCGVVLLALLSLASCARTSYLITVQDAQTRELLDGEVVNYHTWGMFPSPRLPGKIMLSEEGTGIVRIRKGWSGYLEVTDPDGLVHSYLFHREPDSDWHAFDNWNDLRHGTTKYLVRVQTMPAEKQREPNHPRPEEH